MVEIPILMSVADELRRIDGGWVEPNERARLSARAWRLALEAIKAGAFHDHSDLVEPALETARESGPRAALTALINQLGRLNNTHIRDVLEDGVLFLAECIEAYSTPRAARALNRSTAMPAPSDDDDPRLWADPTWIAFRDAYTALIDHPEYLSDKTPEAPEALNMNELNRLARDAGMTTGPVIETREDEDRNRYVIFHHPRVRRTVELRVYNRVPYWPGEPQSKVKLAMDNLRAYCDLRRDQLLLSTACSAIATEKSTPEASNLAASKDQSMPRLDPSSSRVAGPIKCGGGTLLVGNRTIAHDSLAGSLMEVAITRNVKELAPVADVVQARCETVRETLLSLGPSVDMRRFHSLRQRIEALLGDIADVWRDGEATDWKFPDATALKTRSDSLHDRGRALLDQLNTLVGEADDIESDLTILTSNQTRSVELPDEAFVSETTLAEHFSVNQNRLRKALPKWRASHLNNDWHEADHRRPNDPIYTYRVGSMRLLIEDLKATGRRPANGRPKKNLPPGPA